MMISLPRCVHRQLLHYALVSLKEHWIFTRAKLCYSAGNSDRNVSVCPSRAGIVSKRRKIASWFLHYTW